MRTQRRTTEQETPYISATFGALLIVARGRLGVVYRGVSPKTNGIVAIKVYDVVVERADRDTFSAAQERLRQVAEFEGVLPPLQVAIANGHPFVVTEYYERGSIGDRIAASGPLSIRDAVGVAAHCAAVLETLHGFGIVHGNLKPTNLVVSDDGTEMLSDFEVSWTSTVGAEHDVRGVDLQQPHAAPEVLEGGEATTASDVYSLCSSLFEMLAGHPPFVIGDEGPAAYVQHVLRDAPPSINRDDLPHELRRVLSRGLANRPAERFQAAGELRVALEAVELGASDDVTAAAPSARRADPEATIDLRDDGASVGLISAIPESTLPTIPIAPQSLPEPPPLPRPASTPAAIVHPLEPAPMLDTVTELRSTPPDVARRELEPVAPVRSPESPTLLPRRARRRIAILIPALIVILACGYIASRLIGHSHPSRPVAASHATSAPTTPSPPTTVALTQTQIAREAINRPLRFALAGAVCSDPQMCLRTSTLVVTVVCDSQSCAIRNDPNTGVWQGTSIPLEQGTDPRHFAATTHMVPGKGLACRPTPSTSTPVDTQVRLDFRITTSATQLVPGTHYPLAGTLSLLASPSDPACHGAPPSIRWRATS